MLTTDSYNNHNHNNKNHNVTLFNIHFSRKRLYCKTFIMLQSGFKKQLTKFVEIVYNFTVSVFYHKSVKIALRNLVILESSDILSYKCSLIWFPIFIIKSFTNRN